MKNLFHREAKRMTKDINVDEEIFTALLEMTNPRRGEFIQQSAAPLRVAITKNFAQSTRRHWRCDSTNDYDSFRQRVLEEDTLSSDIFATFEALFTKKKLAHLKLN